MARIQGYSEDDVDLLIADFAKIVQAAALRTTSRVADALGRPVTASAQVFHLPGKHNQQTHGHEGVSGDRALAATPLSIAGGRTSADAHDMSGEEFNALRKYRSVAYTRINGRLRGHDVAKSDVDRADGEIALIDSAMSRSHITETITVHRGAGNGEWIPADRRSGDLTGMKWKDNGYLSTSADNSVASSREFLPAHGFMLTITAPHGTSAISLSEMGEEAEILLDRGLTYHVTHDYGVGEDGIRRLNVEVVNE